MNIKETAATAELEEQGRAAKAASRRLAYISTEIKNKALLNIAGDLISNKNDILSANRKDYEIAVTSGMNAAMLDRLMLDERRIEGIAGDVRAVAALPDPVGEIIDMRTMPNGLQIGRKRVPLGVIGAIYESRPNVTIDISVLCLKSGNAVILRGGSETINSNRALVNLVRNAITRAGIPEGAVQFVDNTEHSLVNKMLAMGETIDLIIPRGSAPLIKFIAENACMPVVTGGIGVCHTYVDKTADLKKAVAIVYNAKVQRPTVCNALDTVLVHSEIANRYLPLAAGELGRAGVELHCDERALNILRNPEKIAGADYPIAWSKRYSELPFLYWWTVTPKRLDEIKKSGKIVLGEKDSGNCAVIEAGKLVPLMTPERQIAIGDKFAWYMRIYPTNPDMIIVEGKTPADAGNIEVRWESSVKFTGLKLVPAVAEDWGKEFLSLIAAVKVVDSLEEALSHIEQYSSGHSEAIITEDYTSGIRFLNEVDASAVYINASTRFTDGGQFGLGAEVGISTQKMHARGPMGLKELTSYKWIIYGTGQIRP